MFVDECELVKSLPAHTTLQCSRTATVPEEIKYIKRFCNPAYAQLVMFWPPTSGGMVHQAP